MEYLAAQVNEGKIKVTGENIFLVKDLIKGKKLKPNLNDCELFNITYREIIEAILKLIGIIDNGEPYFVLQRLIYETSLLKTLIDILAFQLSQ